MPVVLPASARILVMQLQQIGDSVVMAPVLRALRRRYPFATIDVLATPVAYAVHRKSPHIRRFHVYPSPNGRISRAWAWARLLRVVRRERYDCVIACANQVSRRYAVIAWLTGAPSRIGFDVGGAGRLFTHRLEPRRGESVVRANLRVAAAVDAASGDARGELWYDDADVRSVDALLAVRGVSADQPIVVIHPGSNWQSKMWYGERWAEVANMALADGMQPVLVGTARDAAAVEVVHQQTCGRLISLIGETDLCQLAALLARATLFVGTDSGPRHVAAAVGCRRVTVMSSLDLPGRWSLDDGETILRSDPPCAGCLQSYCAHRQCMQQITAAQVVAACRRALGVGQQQTIPDLVYAST